MWLEWGSSSGPIPSPATAPHALTAWMAGPWSAWRLVDGWGGGGRCVGTLGLEPTVQMSMALSPDAGAPSCIPEVPVCLTSVVSLLSPIPPEGHILTGKNLTGVNTGFVLK